MPGGVDKVLLANQRERVMPLLEEVREGADDSAGDAESLKAAHRRKRSKGANAKGKKKKKTEVT